jgi:hypothetical protein
MSGRLLFFLAWLLSCGIGLVSAQECPFMFRALSEAHSAARKSDSGTLPTAQVLPPNQSDRMADYHLSPEKYAEAIAYSRGAYWIYFTTTAYTLLLLWFFIHWQIAPRLLRDFDSTASRAPVHPGHGARLECNRQGVPDLGSGGSQYKGKEVRARKSPTIN